MQQRFELERRQNDEKIKNMDAIKNSIAVDAKSERDTFEEQSWGKIDILIENNKSELARSITTGMQQKGDLTKKGKEFRELKQQLDFKERDMEEKNHLFHEYIQQHKDLQIVQKRNKTEIYEREVTLNEKRARI
jgi:hypothetical protein